jgi:chloramphenicol-sensitive protein RarD
MREERDDPTGIAYAAVSYVLWGMFPLYWRLLDVVPPLEIAMHRIFWCALFVGALTALRGRLKRVRDIFRTRRMIQALCVSSLLISANWTIYIFGISTRQVVEAALGYFINPLFSILLGVVFLHERISPLRRAAVALAGGAMVLKAVSLGHVPMIALGLAGTFGLYGLARKKIPVDPLDGLLVETGLLFPLMFAILAYLAFAGAGAFPKSPPAIDTLLIVGGPVTAVPLFFFAAGVRRIRLSTLGFVQYFSPTLTLLIATVLFGEPFSVIDLITFGCIWVALALVAWEATRKRPHPSVNSG